MPLDDAGQVRTVEVTIGSGAVCFIQVSRTVLALDDVVHGVENSSCPWTAAGISALMPAAKQY